MLNNEDEVTHKRKKETLLIKEEEERVVVKCGTHMLSDTEANVCRLVFISKEQQLGLTSRIWRPISTLREWFVVCLWIFCRIQHVWWWILDLDLSFLTAIQAIASNTQCNISSQIQSGSLWDIVVLASFTSVLKFTVDVMFSHEWVIWLVNMFSAI